MDPCVKGSLMTFLFIVSTEVIYQFFKMRKRKTIDVKHDKSSEIYTGNESRLSATSLHVLFFPDESVACREHFTSSSGCLKSDCRFSHIDTSLSRLYKLLISCKHKLDICVYVITCRNLAEILRMLHKRGVKVRIITDNDQLKAPSSQIWALRKEGIPVRTNSSSYFMHHKFTIIDNKILINGSFNWTHQAVTGNHENVMVTDDVAVSSLFVKEFQKLWENFGQNSVQ